jgi:hypothetical protein
MTGWDRVLNRRRNDHLLIERLNESSCPIQVTGHRSSGDARASRRPVAVGSANPPAAYRAQFDFDTLSGPGSRRRPTVIVIDPLANGDYPASEPVAHVVGETPWNPHFAKGRAFCHGHYVWIPNGTQLVDYIIHLGRLLNFEEPPPDRRYTAYNRAAVDWWRRELNYGPLDPSLRFPVIDPTAILAESKSRLSPAGGSRPRGRGQPRRSRLRAAGR